MHYPLEDYLDTSLASWDVLAVILYFVIIIAVWMYATFREYKDTASGHILGGRSLRWLHMGASLFVCNIESEQFFGLAQSGATHGISMGAREFSAIFVIQLLCWIFVPVYMACGVSTTPEYLSKRFGGKRLRVFFVIFSIVLYIMTKISVDLYVGNYLHMLLAPWPFLLTYLVLGVIKLLWGVKQIGNLKPIRIIDPFQCVVALVGAVVVLGYASSRIGGLEGLYREYSRVTGGADFHLLRPAGDYYMPWPGFLFGQTAGFIWYWCADQVIVQRVLVAKSLSHAQGAGLMVGVMKILPLFLMVIPGMIFQTLSSNISPFSAYPFLVFSMPAGLRGLMLAVLLACTFSNMWSTMDAVTTIFAADFWDVVRKDASPLELHRAKQVCFVVVQLLSLNWLGLIAYLVRVQGLLSYIQEMTSYLTPPFAAVFLLGVLVPRTTEKGAFWALILGTLTGVVRVILSLTYTFVPYDSEVAYYLVNNFHYMYFGLFSFLMTGVVSLVISLLSHPPEGHRIGRSTFWTRKCEEQDELQPTDFYELVDTEENADIARTSPHWPQPGFVPTNSGYHGGAIPCQPSDTEGNSHGKAVLNNQADSTNNDSELLFVEGNSDGKSNGSQQAKSGNPDCDLIIVGEESRGGSKPDSSDIGVIIREDDNHGGAKPRHRTGPGNSDIGVIISEDDSHGGAKPRHRTGPDSSDIGVIITEDDSQGGAKPRHQTGPDSSDQSEGDKITEYNNHGGARPRHRTGLDNAGINVEDGNHGGANPRHRTGPDSLGNAGINTEHGKHEEDNYRNRRHGASVQIWGTHRPVTEDANCRGSIARQQANSQHSGTADNVHTGTSRDSENWRLFLFCESWRNPPTERQAGGYKKTLRRRLSRFFKMRSPDDVKQRQLELHIQRISELRQDRMAVIGLRVGLVFVLATGVFLFLFWSLWSPSYAAQLCGEDQARCQDTTTMPPTLI